jgi:hypothetical protein
MFRLFGLLLVGLVLAGCGSRPIDPSGNKIGTSRPYTDLEICGWANCVCSGGKQSDWYWPTEHPWSLWTEEARKRGLHCVATLDIDKSWISNNKTCAKASCIPKSIEDLTKKSSIGYLPLLLTELSDDLICTGATTENGDWETDSVGKLYANEALRRGLSC